MDGPTAIDLFSGCGGLTLGLKQAGFRVIGAVDVDELSVETYRANHPEVRVWHRDIRELSAAAVTGELGLSRGDLDLLAGCPPCQGFSTLRTLNGARAVDDPRKELVFDFLRFVEGLYPKAIMLENVPGLSEDRRLGVLVRRLRELGYFTRRDLLDAQDYGVPQRRRRMILMGSRLGDVDFAARGPVGKTVRDAIGAMPRPGASGDPLHDVPERRSPRIRQVITRIPPNGGSRTDLPISHQLECHKKCNGFKDVYGRMAWDEVAPTITGGCVKPSKGRFLHPEQDRAISLREAALLQGFPNRYIFSLTRGKHAAAELIGNAFPPGFARVHAAQLRKHLRAKVASRRWG